MKLRTVLFLFVSIGIVGFLAGYGDIQAESNESEGYCKIGKVDVSRVFQECERNKQYKAQLEKQHQEIGNKLDTLEKEIESAEGGLGALKPGSADRMERVRELMEKRAQLKAQEEFYQQQLEFKNRRWMEQVYKDILTATEEISNERGLGMVVEFGEPELPAPSRNDLMLTIRTRNVLYSEGCVDITDSVIEKLNAMDK